MIVYSFSEHAYKIPDRGLHFQLEWLKLSSSIQRQDRGKVKIGYKLRFVGKVCDMIQGFYTNLHPSFIPQLSELALS